MNALEDADLLDPRRIEQASSRRAPSTIFSNTFDDISKRDELKNTGFDRRAAAASLRLYLGD